MNDRFKFRAWDIERKEFIKPKLNAFISIEYGQLFDVDMENNNLICIDDYFIVQQCTGIKDLEGKLIYEGDIVSTDDESNTSIAIIIFNRVRFQIEYSEYCHGNLLYYANYPSEIKIIGNICENSDLLENK